MTKIPVLVIDKLKVRKREFFFDKGCKLIKNRLCPMAYKNNELIDVPGYTPSWHLSIIALKFRLFMFSLCLKVFFHPDLSVQMRIVDKGKPLVGSFLNHLRRYLFFTNTKKGFVLWIVPENTNARHLFIESLHVGHLFLMFFVCQLSHNYPFSLFACKVNYKN